MQASLDQLDQKIIDLLQEDASLSAADIGDQVGLSQAACWRRINRLESEGVIRRKVAIVDPEAVGYGTIMLAHVKLSTHGRTHLEQFSEKIRSIPNVLECFLLLGAQDFFIKFAVKDIYEYEKLFFRELSVMKEIAEINSSVVLSEVKNTTKLQSR